MLQEADIIEVWAGPKGDDRTSELDTEQVWIPEVARGSANYQASSPRPEEPVLQLLQHMTFPEP